MQPIQTQQPNQQPQYELGKKPALNEKQTKNMRLILQSVKLPQKNSTYFYNIVQKQSGWGVFDNERLIFLNVRDKAISYLSKIPHGFLPYTNYDQITANKVKQKVMMNEVEGFKCHPVKGKISSMVIEWLDKDKKEKKWTFILGSSKLMNDWVGLINSVKDDTFDKEKYEQMNLINQTSPLTSNQPLTPQMNGNPIDQPINPKNNQQTNPQNNQPINPQNIQTINPQNKQPISAQNNQATNPQKNQQNILPSQLGYGNQKPNQQIASSNLSQLGYNNKSSNQSLPQQQNKQFDTTSVLGYQEVPNISSSNMNNNNPLNNNNPVPLNNNNTVPLNNNNTVPLNNNNPVPLNNNSKSPYMSYKPQLNNNPNALYANTNPTNQSNNSNRLNSPTDQNYLPNSNINNQPISNSYNQPNAQNTPEQLPTFKNPQQSKQPSPPNNNNTPYLNQPNLANTTLIPPYQSTVKPSYVQPSNNNQILPPPQNSRQLIHNPSEPPGDFVEELKRKRQKNPQMFVLNNQLSKKNLNQYNTLPYAELNHPDYYNTSQSHPNTSQSQPNQPISSNNPLIDPMQRIPSQKSQFNRQPSYNHIQPHQRQSIYGPKQSQHRPIPRQNTNQNMEPLIGDPSKKQFKREPSKSQISNNLPINDTNSRLSNQLNVNEQDDYQGYKPSTSWPESTKNLNKIRSDYLERKASNLGTITNQPGSTKNQNNRLMESNYVKQDYMHQPSDQNSKKYSQQSKKHTDPSYEKLPKFDSSQSRRQDSINNLNKVSSSYMSKNKIQHPSYNEIWLETSNPNKKLQVHDQFMTRSRELVCSIVDEIAFPKSQREFEPVESDENENLYMFVVENMIIKLHFFTQQQSINDTDDNINQDAPLLYSHATYQQIKRQFYNYNLILGVTGNQGRIKVPLCSYIQYRGVLALVRADVPPSYREVEPYTYSDQFEALENMIKVRFMFNTFNCYESQGFRGGDGKFIVLWNLRNLIPAIPNNLKISSSYFRKEFLLQYDEILQDLESCSEAHAFTIKHFLPQFLAKLQSLEIHILSSKDLLRECHKAGLSLSNLSQMYKQTNSHYLKKLLMSEIVSQIFAEIVRSQLNHAFAILPAQNMQNSSRQEINDVVVGCAHVLINELFSYTQRSQSIWRLIVNEASKRHRMIVSKEDVVGGYLLSGIVDKLGLECDFKQKSFVKQKKFFVHENIIPRDVLITFMPKTRQYDMQAICPSYSKCKQILQSQQMTVQSYQQLSMILNLRTRTTQLPEYYRPLMQQLKTYIANYIPYTSEHEYQHLDVYEFMYEQPISYNGTRAAFLAIKWLIKTNQVQKANQLFEIKFHQLSYWFSQYNTAITQFYDFFSMYYASLGDFDQSICLAKSSLINMTKVLGPGALPVADKHYQLGNIYFKINKKNQALKEYNKTKQILLNHDKTTIPEYGIILLKIALLSLNFGELNQCLANAIQAETIFQNNGGNQHEEIECFEILSRVYEITRKQQDIISLCEACGKTFNTTQNPKILQRMCKIVLFPKLSTLSSQQQKSLYPLLTRLEQHNTSDPSFYLDSFNFLHRMASKGFNIKRKLYYYLENVVILAEEVNRRDLIRKHVSFSEKSTGQAEEMLVVVEAVSNMIGWSFLIGALKEGYYD